MRISKRMAAITASLAIGGALTGTAATASAAYPDFSDCPRAQVVGGICVHIQSRNGYMDIKGFRVPIGESFQIRGGIKSVGDTTEFVAPRGTNGVFSKPIQIPGGILGINFPLPGNAVTATAQLAGPASSIRLDINTASVQMPLKLKLSNPIIGSGCQIGSDANPVRVNLIVGTTSPPAPNRPISGVLGEQTYNEAQEALVFLGDRNVDNSFSIPGASGCGINLGLINSLINLKLKLPSAGGNNALVIDNDLAFRAA